MSVSELPKKTLPLIALISAAWLPAWAADAPVKDISDAAMLREVLTAATPDGETIKATYDGYTLKIVSPELLVPVEPGAMSNSNPNGVIVVVPTNVLLTGDGSASTTLRTEGPGDLLGIDSLAYSFANLKISGSGTGATDADGRFAILQAASVSVKGDTIFADRFFSSNERTGNASSGGIFYSSNAADVITLDATDGAISFSGITTYGDTLSVTDPESSETVEVKNAAAGGAIFLNGTLKIQGGNAIDFSGNKAESKEANAFGGALYVTSTEEESAKYGIQVGSGTHLNFNNNQVVGETAQGGAVILVSGALKTEGARLTFSGNSATAKTGSALGGAWVVANASTENSDAASRMEFSGNSVRTSAECDLASGGALYVEDSTLSSAAGEISFSANKAIATADGSSASGGAFAIAGEKSVAEFTGTADSVFSFSENSVSVSGKSKDKEVEIDGQKSMQTFTPEALGGAIAATGGKLSFTNIGQVAFTKNAASVSVAGTQAKGGAIYIGGSKTEVDFSALGTWTFSKNKAIADGAGRASGGALAQDAGSLKLAHAANLVFSENAATGTATGTEIVMAVGGAIAQNGDARIYTVSGNATLYFSENTASVVTENSGSHALGGALAQLSRNAEMQISGKADFSKNVAEVRVSAASVSGSASQASGGAVYSTGKLTLDDAAFTENTAIAQGVDSVAFGGAVYLSGGIFSAKALNFENNGAVATDAAGTLPLGSARGGAIYQSSGTAEIQSGVFSGNGANGEIARGGAVYLGGTFKTSGKSTFTGNSVSGTSEAAGGAVYLTGNLVLGDGAAFSGNTATASATDGVALGGAIYSAGTLNVEGTGTILSGNTATASNGVALGGAIYLRGGNLRLDNATLSGNSATGTTARGGAIYVDASGNVSTTLTLGGNTTLSGNTANDVADGITIGNGTADASVLSKNVSVKIASGATFSTTSDADGNETTTRDSFETVTLSDPLNVSLKGADFTLEKTTDGGDFVWGGVNKVELESVDVNGTATGGKFNLAFRSGKTTLVDGFALTGTSAAKVEVDADAELAIASGATFCNFNSMTLDGVLNVSGTLNLANSTISVSNAGQLLFGDGTISNVSGENKVDGILTTNGNVKFTADFSDAATEVSLSVTSLFVEKSGNVTFNGGSATESFVVTASDIYFAESGELTLATGTKLLLKSLNAIDPEDSLEIAINGAGTLVLLDETEENNTIAFNSYYDSENKKLVGSNFSVGGDIKIEKGIFVSSGTMLDLGGLNYENVVVDGGTISASGSSAANPLKIKTLSVKSSVTIGDGQTTQFIELLDTVDDNNVATTQKVALSGDLKILAGATFIADASIQNYASAGLSGEGTLQGNVSGSGVISIAKIDGSVTMRSTDRTTFSGTTLVTGDVSNNAGRVTLTQGAYLSTQGVFKNEATGRVNLEGGVRFSGEILNEGTFTFTGNSVIESGSRFVQTSEGSLVLEPGASVDFSKISGTTDALSLEGTLVLNPGDYVAGDEFTGLLGLQNGQLDALKITDNASNLLTDRFMWNDALGSYVFLGLNGRKIETTLYGDLVRENVFRIYDFMRAALERGKVASIHPSVFGEKKETSRYMRKYLERKNRFNQSDDKPSVPAPVEESAPGEFGRAANALMNNVWVQAQYGYTNASASEGHLDYGIHSRGALIGTSYATGTEDEIGAVFAYNSARMKHNGENAHKIDIDAYELMAFYRHIGESYDGTLALSGAYATNESERGLAEADFNSWQVGALAEGGVTFRPESWCEIRPYASVQFAYSRTNSFRETGADDAFELDAADAFAARGSFGLGVAFLPFDSVQLSFKAAWNLDLGDSVIDVDAYQQTTRSDVALTSRELERSSFDLGAYLNYRVNANVSVYTGYTGILRSGHEEHRADLGVNFAF